MNNVKIGTLEIFSSQTLLIHDFQNNEAWIEVLGKGLKLKFKLLFEIDSDDKRSRFDMSGNDDHGTIKFINWDGEKAAFGEPIVCFETDGGRKVFVMAFGMKAGKAMKLDLQFSLEAEDE
jgi:hypothetical protein